MKNELYFRTSRIQQRVQHRLQSSGKLSSAEKVYLFSGDNSNHSLGSVLRRLFGFLTALHAGTEREMKGKC